MKSKSLNVCLSALLLLAAAGTAALYSWSFYQWIVPAYGAALALLFLTAAAGTALFSLKKGRTKRSAILRGVVVGALCVGILFVLTFLINNVLTGENKPWIAALAVTIISFVLWLCWGLRYFARAGAVKKAVAALLALCVLLGGCLPIGAELSYQIRRYSNPVAAPTGTGTYTETERTKIENADLYVAPDGSDENDGSFDHPLATVEKARDLVRAMDKTGKTGITVALKAGEYRVASLRFTAEDGGTEGCSVTYRAYGDGEVILNGGVTLPRQALRPVTDEAQLARLSEDARKNVLAADLSSLGITAEQYGRLHAVGAYNTADKYDGDWTGDGNCELFVDDLRQTMARYPNGTKTLRTGEVVKEGFGRESFDTTFKEGYADVRNPESDIYKLDKKLAARIASWQTTEDVWMFGYWRWDWADASTPLGNVDHENLTISPMFVSVYGAIKGAPYYFYNVFEELDAPGEWYLDRDNGVLYFYPPEGFSEDSSVELSLTTDCIIKAEADYLTFDGLTIKGTRGDAVDITGDGNTVQNCLIKNTAGNALRMTGYDNLVFGNEITRTGRGGVILSGGDRETLTPGNNRAENNLVHDWSEVFETYQPAFTLEGVGNVCAHNEMYNSPHEAITFAGNNHVMEYNVIHHVNLKTDDGGAIYANAHWDWCGNLIRYNCIYDLGADGHQPLGIYMDGHLSGETVYGNLIVNVPGAGIHLNGGRFLEVHNNIVVNTRNHSIWYRQGGIDDSSEEGGRLWRWLYESPWQSELWQQTYPSLSVDRFSDDFDNQDDPNFMPNPAYSNVTGNLIVSIEGEIGEITEPARKFSNISGNATYKLSALKKLFVDPDNGDYTLRDDAPVFDEIPDFAQLPLNEIGRY